MHGNEGDLEEAWEKGDVIDHSVGSSLAEWCVLLKLAFLLDSFFHLT